MPIWWLTSIILVGLAFPKARILVFRFIIEYSRLRDFGPLVNRSKWGILEICWTVPSKTTRNFHIFSSNSHCCHANLQTMDKLNLSSQKTCALKCMWETNKLQYGCKNGSSHQTASLFLQFGNLKSVLCVLTLTFHQISILYQESIRLDLHISKTRIKQIFGLLVFIRKKVYIFFLVLLSCTGL
jgi:hypothetical protein